MKLLEKLFGLKKAKRKVALINVADYPEKLYTAYWEIRVDGDDEIGYEWGCRMLSYKPVAWRHKGNIYDVLPDNLKLMESAVQGLHVLEEAVGAEMTRAEADTKAQKWVLNNIKKYRKGEE